MQHVVHLVIHAGKYQNILKHTYFIVFLNSSNAVPGVQDERNVFYTVLKREQLFGLRYNCTIEEHTKVI